MFGKGKRATQRLLDRGVRTPAEALDVKLGRFTTNTNSGVGGSLESMSSSRTLRLRIEPPGEAPYETTLELDRRDPMVPVAAGFRMEVLVDPNDANNVALVPQPVFTLPGGKTWQPDSDLARLAEQGDVDGMLKKLDELAADAKDKPGESS